MKQWLVQSCACSYKAEKSQELAINRMEQTLANRKMSLGGRRSFDGKRHGTKDP
jgi:hypothetical protein